MRIWIDLANSPHVPFFGALIPEFEKRGHGVETSARDYAQTVELASEAGMSPVVIGRHGGGRLSSKAGSLLGRAWSLAAWARGRAFDLAVSHNSYSQIVAARVLRIRTVSLMDYEHQPANHLAFRLASRIVVPRAFPDTALRRYGAKPSRVKRYDGNKEDVYLADFSPDQGFAGILSDLGIEGDDILVVVRPPAGEALYHRFDNKLFGELLEILRDRSDVKVILLARTPSQLAEFVPYEGERFILPRKALDGSNLIASADLVISAGGTMNREAAALGVPAATIYAGEWAAVDEELVREGRLYRIATRSDIESLPIVKKGALNPRRSLGVRGEVANLVLEREDG
jgi:predicted glycosyltransferase